MTNAPTAKGFDMTTDDKLLARIGKLANQAENAGTEAEAATYLQEAQRLATKHAIDLAVARSFADKTAHRTLPVQKSVAVGAGAARILRTHTLLLVELCQANDVECDIASNNRTVYMFGFAEDIAITELLFSTVLPQMIAASRTFISRGEWKDEQAYRRVRKRHPWGGVCYSMEYAPITQHAARVAFQSAYAERIHRRLAEARRDTIDEAKRSDQANGESGETSTELALRNKELAVTDFYKEHTRARGSWRGGQATATSSTGHRAGRSAANKADLSTSGGRPQLGTTRRSLTP